VQPYILNGLDPHIGINVNSVVHSHDIVGFTKLGFTGPSVVAATFTANQVIALLNLPVSDSHFVPTTP
jgi:hypothetical protein